MIVLELALPITLVLALTNVSTLEYVKEKKDMLFKTPLSQLMHKVNEYKAKQPTQISYKFKTKIDKSEAVKRYKERKCNSQATLWPSSEYKLKSGSTVYMFPLRIHFCNY